MFSAKSELMQTLRICAPYALRTTPILLTTLLISLLGLLPPWLTGRVIDALTSHDIRGLQNLLILYLAAVIAGTILNFANTLLTTRLRETFARDVRCEMIDALYEAPFDTVTAISPGEITNRLTSDIDSLSALLQNSFFPLFSAIVLIVTTAFAMFSMNATLAGISFVILALLWLPTASVASRLARLRTLLSEAKDRLAVRIAETLQPGALSLIKNWCAQDFERSRFASAASEILTINYGAAKVSGAYSFFASFLTSLGPVVTLAVGAHYVSQGSLTVGTVVALMSYQIRIYGPAGTIWGMQMQMAGVFAILRRVSMILHLPIESDGPETPIRSNIAFRDVSLNIDSKRILSGVTIDIADGEHVAIVGPSGSGKSSLTSLLIRLRDPSSGTISLGGVPLQSIPLEYLRTAIRVVAQEGHLFNDSISSNIRYGLSNIQNSAEIEALEISELMDEIRSPRLSALIGTRGALLSGGERQRVNLARGLLAATRCLILDESTSAVDSAIERRIISSVREHMRGRTLIVITHRISSIIDMDRIFVMQDGNVVASGGHPFLVNTCALYRDLSSIPSPIDSPSPEVERRT